MGKTTAADIKEEGFTYEMFPNVADDAAFTIYIDKIIANKTIELEGLIGISIYNDSTEPTANRVKATELNMVLAELIKRRINKQLGNVSQKGEALSTKADREQLKVYQEETDTLIATLIGQTSVAFGTVKTSHFNDESNLD